MEAFLGYSGGESINEEPSSQQNHTLRPCIIPGYQVLEELGRGGMGVVHRARQLRPSRVVALKIMRPDRRAGLTSLARFRAESEAVARLQHPNIVQIYEVGEEQDIAFFSMEYCSGGNLSQKLNGAPLPAQPAAALVEALASAMHAAHRAGVIHRDLKPDNILLTAAGAPKIADFGLARRIDADLRHTISHSVLGTPSYMAPEQLVNGGKEVGPAADIYALGAILYELLTGRPPFRAASVLDTLEQVRSQEPVPVRRLQSRTPRDLDTICLKCLQKEGKDRYESAEALGADLRRYQEGKPIKARRAGPMDLTCRWCRQRPLVTASALFTLVAALLLLAGSFWHTARMGELRGQLIAAEARVDAAHEIADARRYAGLLASARERRVQGRPGWTWAAKEDLMDASRMDVRVRRSVELRTELASCLSGVDMRLAGAVGEGQFIRALAFHPNGRLIALGQAKAAAFSYCAVRLVDSHSGDVVQELPQSPSLSWQIRNGVQDGVSAVAFSPDGRRLAAGMRSGQLYCWDLSVHPPMMASWQGHDGEVSWVRFGLTGEDLFTAAADGRVCRWPGGMQCENPPTYHHDGDANPTLDLSGGWVACGGGAKIDLLDPQTLQPIGKPLTVSNYHLAASPDGFSVAASLEGSLQLIDAADGRILRTFRAPGRETAEDAVISDLAFSPQGNQLVAASRTTNRVRLWDIASGSLQVDQLAGGDSRPAFRPDGRVLAVAVQNRTLLFELGGLREETSVALQPGPALDGVYSPDGQTLASLAKLGPGRGQVALWPLSGRAIEQRPSEGRQETRPPGPRTRFPVSISDEDGRRIGFDPTGALFAVAQPEETVLLETARFGPVHRLAIRNVHDLSFDAGGLLWTVAGSDLDGRSPPDWNKAIHWSNAPSNVMTGLGGLKALAAGRHCVLAGSRDGRLRLYQSRNGDCLEAWPLAGGEIRCAALNSDESLAAAGSESGDLHVLGLQDGKPLNGMRAHDDAVQSIAFSGSLLATGSRDHTVRLWRCEGGTVEELLTLREPGSVSNLAFSPDGDQLAVLVQGEWALRVWRISQLRQSLDELGLNWSDGGGQ